MIGFHIFGLTSSALNQGDSHVEHDRTVELEAAIESIDLESYKTLPIFKKTVLQPDESWEMDPTKFLVPLAVGIGIHFLPRLMGRIFPIGEDRHIGSAIRTKIRGYFEGIANQNEKMQNIFYVVIPDNIGLAAGIVSLCLFRRKGLIAVSNLLPMIGLTLAIIAGIHQIRVISLRIFGPVSKKYLPPIPGTWLGKIFKSLGPSRHNF